MVTACANARSRAWRDNPSVSPAASHLPFTREAAIPQSAALTAPFHKGAISLFCSFRLLPVGCFRLRRSVHRAYAHHRRTWQQTARESRSLPHSNSRSAFRWSGFLYLCDGDCVCKCSQPRVEGQSLRLACVETPPFHKGGSNLSVTAAPCHLPFTREAMPYPLLISFVSCGSLLRCG